MLKRINSPFRVSVIYATIGGLWILWSDNFLIKYIQDVQTLSTFQTYKGWFYVLFTTLLLYGLTNNLVIRIQTGEERISTLSNTLPIGLFYTTPEGKIKDVNITMVEILAYPDKETLLSKGPGDLYVDPTDREQLIAILENEGSIRNFVTRFYQYNGEIVWLEGHMTLTEDSYGNPIYEGGFVDITERKKTEQELNLNAERHRVFFEESPALNWHYELQPPMPLSLPVDEQIDWMLHKSSLEEVNKNIMALMRLSEEELDDVYGLSLYDNWGRDERLGREIIKELIEQGYQLRMYETRESTISGEETWSNINCFGVIEDNHLVRIMGTTLDFSDRKLAEEELRESEERYRTLFESTTDVLFIMRNTRIIDCNQIVSKMFGYTKDEILGKHPEEFSPPRQPDGLSSFEKAERIFQEVIEGSPQLFEWIHQRKDGSLFTAEVFLHKVIIQGDDYNMAIVRDITERKMAEEAAQEERQRLARELHDAVSQTLWSASLIADVLPNVWQKNPAKGLERLGRLRQLTRSALAEMRTLLLELRPHALIETKMVDLLNQLIEAISSRSEAQISIDFEGECDLPEDVHVALYRIAQEALNNATRHAMASDIKVRLKCEPKYVKLEIEDNGRGFDPDSVPTGQHLGLRIMGERASSIGASLEIISRPNEGTNVILIWPDDSEVNDG